MIIKSSTKNYEVKIGTDFEMAKNLALDATCFVVVDSNLYRLYKDELFSSIPEEQLYVMEAVEEKKTIETALDICEIMTNIPAKRNARLISFGGGIVQDVTGFVANILYRGIHWTFYPTTLLAAEIGEDVRMAKRAGLLHDIGKAVDHEMEGSHIQLGAELCKKYKESPLVINAVESHHGDVEPESLIACLVQAADTISAARPGARRETLETYSNRLQQLEDITNGYKGVEKSFAIQAGREIRIMVVPEQVSDADMVIMARDISKQIESELEYPGQIKVNVIRESRIVDYAK